MQRSLITVIASKVKADFEAGRIERKVLKKLYQQYNRINNIDIFLKSAGNMFPELNCGLTSVYLKKIFPDGEIINGKYENNNHTFILLNDFVVDITADQYGGPKVYVGTLKRPWALS